MLLKKKNKKMKEKELKWIPIDSHTTSDREVMPSSQDRKGRETRGKKKVKKHSPS